MNSGDPQSRDWRAQAPSRTAYSREWRGSGRSPSRYSRRFLLRLTILGLTIVAAVIVALLVPWSGSARPLHVVSFGIGAYGGRAQPQGNMPLNPFGEQDAKSFRVLAERAPQQFPSVKSEDNALTSAQFLTFLRSECESPELANRNLLLFCTLHGVVQSSGEIELFAIDATPTSSGAMVPLSSVLAILRDSRASRVLLALDTFRLEADWRLGILVNEIAAQLEADQPKSGHGDAARRSAADKVTLLLAANSGERSWYDDQGSVFARALREGLLGDADRALGQAGENAANGDGRVSLLELTSYVRHAVADWSKRRRGAPQSVSVLGNTDDFVLAQVTPPAPPAVERKETPEPPAKDEKIAPEAPKEAEPKGEAAGPALADKPKAPPAAPPLPPEERLRQLWSKLDELRNVQGDGRNIACRQMPFASRSFTARLVQAESLRHGGFPELVPDLLDQATKQLQRIAQGDSELARLLPDGPAQQSAAALGWSGTRIPAAALTAADQGFQALLAPPPKTPMPTPPPAPPAPMIPTPAVIEAWFTQQLADPSAHDRLRNLAVLEKGGSWPQTPDCLLIRNVLQLDGPDADLTAEATQRILGLRRELRVIVLRYPDSYPALHAAVADGLRNLTAAERWLLEAGPRQPQVRTWLDRAEAAVVQARRAGQRHADLVGLWSDLLAELPAVAAWVAARASDEEQRPVVWNDVRRVAEVWSQSPASSLDATRLQETWPDKPSRLTNPERRLLLLFGDAQRLQAAIGAKDPAGAEDLDLAVVSRHRRELWKEVDEAVPQLGTRNRPTPSEWWDADRLLRAPFLPAEDRPALDQLLRSDPSHAGAARDVNADALWQGFWAIATLDLMQSGNSAGLWKKWDRLAELTQASQPDLLARRAELGRTIRDEWTNLQSQAEALNTRGLAELQLVAAVLDPHLVPRRDPDGELRQSASRSFGDWLMVFAADWRGRAADPQGSDYQRLADCAESLAVQLSARETRPSAAPAMLQVQGGRFDAARRSRLEASASADGRDGLQLLLVPAPVRWSRGGKSSRLNLMQALPIPADGRVDVDLELEDQVVAPEKMVVALAAADGFPLQFRTIQLTPPFDPSQWRIEFVDVESQTPLEASPLAGINGVKLFFAPSAEISVQARLIRPPQDTTPAVRIKLLQITGGDPIVLRDNLEVKLAGPQTPVVFDLPVAPEKTDAAAPPPAPAAVQADLARGWIFEIVPEGGDPFRYVVKPAFWSAAKFIDDPQPALQDGRFVLDLQRRAVQSALLPQKIEVVLDPSAAVARVLTDPTLRGPLEPGQNSTLGFTLPEDWRAQAARSEWKVALGVAGLPHAYRWRLRDTGNVDPLGGQPEQLEVRLLLPRNDKGVPVRDVPVLESGKDPLQIQLQVFADTLDRIDDPQDWRLVYRVVRITDDKPQATPFGHEWPLLSSVERHVELVGVKAGTWKFRTAARDYEHEFSADDLRGLLGRFTVQAELRRGGRREPLAQQSLVFALDNDAPPKIESKFLAAEAKGCRMRIGAVDAESGIRRVTVGIDTNGDKQLTDTEIFETRNYPLFGENHPSWDTTIPWPKFPPLEKTTTTYVLLVQAQNGLGVTGSQNVTVQYNPPKASTVGTLVIDMKLSGAAKATVELKGPQAKTVNASSSPVSIGDLPPGTYQIEASVLDVVVGTRKSGKASAEVKAGGTTSVSIPLSSSK